jgi:fucose 4-O-acetylase-like acetyltransferase
MKDQFIEQCLLILSREDVKKELKELFKPIISFLLILGIFYLLLRSNLKTLSLK